ASRRRHGSPPNLNGPLDIYCTITMKYLSTKKCSVLCAENRTFLLPLQLKSKTIEHDSSSTDRE
ncbi:hypothetical protein, partial [Bacteroides acidifaciens]|uniref:hypothetical protein n=1 Tax=Bacteroides acidifaciens TaxID=85831 RepID=UPI002574C7FF